MVSIILVTDKPKSNVKICSLELIFYNKNQFDEEKISKMIKPKNRDFTPSFVNVLVRGIG